MFEIAPSDALIVVDPQNDFLPGGTLAVPQGNGIFGPINRLMPLFSYVVATRDWHPKNHAYFRANGGPWPWHCLARTEGARFSPLLDTDQIDDVISKGTDPQTDGYSGFAGTDLAEKLHQHGITRVFVAGLATDYCVRATALDARDAGFGVVVLDDAIAGIDATPGDTQRALDEMRSRGVRIADSGEIAGIALR
jgi:nicotinamidase/pyrazinamidase